MEEQILDQNLNQESQFDFDAREQELLTNGYNFDMGRYIKKGFDIFKMNIGGFIGYFVVMILITAVGNLIPKVGQIITSILAAPLGAGFFIVAKKLDKNEPVEFNDFFGGFKFTWQLFLAYLIMAILTIIGLVLLVIPGIYLAVGYAFTYMIVVFANKDFWPAMESSRKIITKKWWSFFGFFIVLFLINILGILAFFVGIFVTLPASAAALYAAYDDIIGTN